MIPPCRSLCATRHWGRRMVAVRVWVIRGLLASRSRSTIARSESLDHARRDGRNEALRVRSRSATRNDYRRNWLCSNDSGAITGRTWGRTRHCGLSLFRSGDCRNGGLCCCPPSLRCFRPLLFWGALPRDGCYRMLENDRGNAMRLMGSHVCMGREHCRSVGRAYEPGDPCLPASFRREGEHCKSPRRLRTL
jgi:hypothetical protein